MGPYGGQYDYVNHTQVIALSVTLGMPLAQVYSRHPLGESKFTSPF